jgi:hydroxymethylglutaryl-CoA lyase
MQGLHPFIPTRDKVEYLNLLLDVGFDTLDFGSFVSPKAIPQMRDTGELVSQLNLDSSKTKLLAIVANQRGATDAAAFDEITYLGYPFSISETFQLRNTNATIEQSLERVKVIQEICINSNKTLVIYISMGFGNPYGDEWNVNVVQHWVEVLTGLGITIIQLSDTVGVAQPDSISYLFNKLIPKNPETEIGAHFHTTPTTWIEKVQSAYDNGCRRYDGTIMGLGGCPMAQDSLVGNMPSEHLIQFAQNQHIDLSFNLDAYQQSVLMAQKLMIH